MPPPPAGAAIRGAARAARGVPHLQPAAARGVEPAARRRPAGPVPLPSFTRTPPPVAAQLVPPPAAPTSPGAAPTTTGAPAAAHPAAAPPPAKRVSLDEAAPIVPLVHDVGFKPLEGPPGGGRRRFTWPLFGATELPPVTPAQAALAARLFGRGARYLGDQHDHVKPEGQEPAWTEVVVMGRSNVGKSTLLNRLLGSADDRFVRVSRHPGSTTHLDWYGLGTDPAPAVCLVDTPGYGYNMRGKGRGDGWLEEIARYLAARTPAVLGRTLLLLDARQGVTPIDRDVMALLEEQHVPWHAVLTKVDAVGPGELEAAALTVAMELRRWQMPFPALNGVSGRTSEGLAQLQEMVVVSSKLHRRLGGDTAAGGGGRGLPPPLPGGGAGRPRRPLQAYPAPAQPRGGGGGRR